MAVQADTARCAACGSSRLTAFGSDARFWYCAACGTPSAALSAAAAAAPTVGSEVGRKRRRRRMVAGVWPTSLWSVDDMAQAARRFSSVSSSVSSAGSVAGSVAQDA